MKSPNSSPAGPQLHVPRLSRASSNVSLAEERGIDESPGLTIYNGLQIALYTRRSQASRTSHNVPGY